MGKSQTEAKTEAAAPSTDDSFLQLEQWLNEEIAKHGRYHVVVKVGQPTVRTVFTIPTDIAGFDLLEFENLSLDERERLVADRIREGRANA